MTAKQSERAIRSLEVLANAFDRLATLAERLYPPPQESNEPTGVYRRGDTTPEPQSLEEYDNFPEQPGRYQQVIEKAKKATST